MKYFDGKIPSIQQSVWSTLDSCKQSLIFDGYVGRSNVAGYLVLDVVLHTFF